MPLPTLPPSLPALRTAPLPASGALVLVASMLGVHAWVLLVLAPGSGPGGPVARAAAGGASSRPILVRRLAGATTEAAPLALGKAAAPVPRSGLGAGARDPADASAAPPSPGGRAWPTYATRLPDSTALRYRLQRGDASGHAELRWLQSDGRYALSLESSLDTPPGRPPMRAKAPAWHSEGAIDAHGVAPGRYVESQAGRELRATSFQRDSGRITFSGGGREQLLLPGAQDRLSWLVQLGAVLAADPSLATPGRELTLFVAGARGEARPWTFRIIGAEALNLPGGAVIPAWLLKRQAQAPYDTEAEVWLDPVRQFLPVRLRLRAPPARLETELVIEAEPGPAEVPRQPVTPEAGAGA